MVVGEDPQLECAVAEDLRGERSIVFQRHDERQPLSRTVAQHKIEQALQIADRSIRMNAQFLDWLMEPIDPDGGIAERLCSRRVPSSKRGKHDLPLREVKSAHAQLIRAWIWLVRLVRISADQIVE